MAIVKMKKLRLMAVRSQKEELLRELIRQGCVEFSELEGEVQGSQFEGLVTRESSGLMGFKSQHAALLSAVAVLDRYAPVKKGLLSAKPQVEADVLLDESGLDRAMSLAEKLTGTEERIKRISAEESRQRSSIEALQPWADLNLPLETTGTGRCAAVLGTVSAKVELNEVDSALAQVTEEAELFRVSEDKNQHYLLLVCLKEEQAAVMESLRGFGFAVASVSGMKGTARENIALAEKSLRELAKEKEDCVQSIVDLKDSQDELKLAADVVSTKIARAEAEDKLYGMKSVVFMQGWMPAEKETELAGIFDKYECAWETEDPDPSEYPDVPVKLKNNKVTNALNMVTEMYSLPAYDGVDPNPLMAPFFILFYGLMMADMGYGLIMILAALVAMKKIKPREGTLTFCQLLLYGGISTFVMGALTGGFFGDALVQIGGILGKPEGWGALPYLFSPLDQAIYVLIGSMVLGVIHLNTGMVISVVQKVKHGDVAGAVWEEGALWVTLVGIILFVLKIGNVSGVPVVLVIGCVMVLFGGTRGAKGFGKLTSIFGTLYNTLTGWFGDILSYSRIMALMLAGSVIAQVFNTIGAIANNLVVFFLIFLVGHALNFALNLLGCYVHDLRLQCLEYFGKFYKDGGRAFAPLRIKTKYYDTVEQ